MDAKEVLKKNASKIRNECDAKSLMLEIGNIFTSSTAQEIHRVLDREGNIIAMDMILNKLPQRDNWVKVLYKALNSKDIKKPKLAELFEPFLNEESDTEVRYNSRQSYSLENCLVDNPRLMPHINKYGLDTDATLGDLMDTLYRKDRNAYELLKNEIGITHSYVRQATTNEETVSADFTASDGRVLPHTTTKSLPVMPDTNNSSPSNCSDFQPAGIAPLREAIYFQEKALKKTAQNQVHDVASLPESVYYQEKALQKAALNETTVSLPTIQARPLPVIKDKNLTNYQPTMQSLVHEKKILEVDEDRKGVSGLDKDKVEFQEVDVGRGKVGVLKMDSCSVEVPQVDFGSVEVLQVDGGSVEVPRVDFGSMEVPRVNGGSEEVPRVDGGSEEVPRVDGGSVEAPQVDGGSVEAPRVDSGSMEVPRVDSGSMEVPRVDSGSMEVPRVDSGSMEVPRVDSGSMEVPRVDSGSMEVPRVDSGSMEVPRVDGGSMEVPRVDGGSVEVPQVDGGSVEVPRVDGGSVEVPRVDGGLVEVPQVHEVLECDQNAERNQKIFSKTQYIVIVAGMALSFCLGYFLHKR